ncbi:hypothetical protein scyTo_0008176 [Scyliorhinus torazame]|uniref:Uncharacterized protein n=1 Tax=Scyliorhinus torazame TaxID=75743 RepID=A0A401P4Q1_SCYTO|nr:hypothetical protein [Scyliorhinus torazame]
MINGGFGSKYSLTRQMIKYPVRLGGSQQIRLPGTLVAQCGISESHPSFWLFHLGKQLFSNRESVLNIEQDGCEESDTAELTCQASFENEPAPWKVGQDVSQTRPV